MRGYNGGTKTIAATTAATYVFNDSEIPNGGVGAFSIVTTGANNHLTSAVTRNRVKLSGAAIWDAPSAAHRALIEAIAPANTIPPASRLRYTIPLNLPGVDGSVGIPFNTKPSVEVIVDANSSAGTAQIGWLRTAGQPRFMPKFLGFASGVGASVTNGRIPLNIPDGLVYGISFPLVGATGVTRARVVLNGIEVINLSQDHLLEGEFLTNPQSLTTTLFVRMPVLLPATPGISFIEVDTGAGAAVTDEYVPLSLHNVAA